MSSYCSELDCKRSMTPEVYSISPILKADLVALLRAALGADAVGVIFVVGGFQRVDLLVRAAGGAFVVGIAIFFAGEVLLKGCAEGVFKLCVVVEENEAAFGAFSFVDADARAGGIGLFGIVTEGVVAAGHGSGSEGGCYGDIYAAGTAV